MNWRRWSAHSLTTAGTLRLSEPSARFVYGSASVSVWMHSYCSDLAAVFWMMVASGSSSLRASRGSCETRRPSSLTTLMSIQLFEDVVSRRKNCEARVRLRERDAPRPAPVPAKSHGARTCGAIDR